MTFTLDSRKFEYVDQLKPAPGMSARQTKGDKRTQEEEAKEEKAKSDGPAAAAMHGAA